MNTGPFVKIDSESDTCSCQPKHSSRFEDYPKLWAQDPSLPPSSYFDAANASKGK